MVKKILPIAALAVIVSAAFLVYRGGISSDKSLPPQGFVQARGGRFVFNGRPFRFVGANVAVIYGDEERALMPTTLREAARAGIGVVRIWASGESGPGDGTAAGVAQNEWLRVNP